MADASCEEAQLRSTHRKGNSTEKTWKIQRDCARKCTISNDKSAKNGKHGIREWRFDISSVQKVENYRREEARRYLYGRGGRGLTALGRGR